MEQSSLAGSTRTLLIAGALLFLLGLLQGAVVQFFANPRMGLSAHLTAVQSGTAVMVAGLAWRYVSLTTRLSAVAVWNIIGGMYGLWLGLTLSAATGASAVLPIAGAGYSAALPVELGVAALIYLSSAAIVIGWALLVLGLWRSRIN